MVKQNNGLASLEDLLAKIETDVKRAKLMIQQLSKGWGNLENTRIDMGKISEQLGSYSEAWDIQVVEGVFDGYFMIGSDKKKYPIPMNYASKSKLIPGDVLKLRIMTDGKMIYKLTGQANRQYIRATLSKSDDNKFTAITDEGKIYFLNQAAVTYYKGKTGDELSIIINADGIGNFAAIEALIPQGG